MKPRAGESYIDMLNRAGLCIDGSRQKDARLAWAESFFESAEEQRAWGASGGIAELAMWLELLRWAGAPA